MRSIYPHMDTRLVKLQIMKGMFRRLQFVYYIYKSKCLSVQLESLIIQDYFKILRF